jgi:hypothetical protein
LIHKGLWGVCVDEMPNLQAIERSPIRRDIAGSIEQQEFEYIRHGTVNVLISQIPSFIVHAFPIKPRNRHRDINVLALYVTKTSHERS